MADAIFFLPHNIVDLKHYKSYFTLSPPMGIAYLAAMLRKHKYSVKLVDLAHEFVRDFPAFLEFLKKENPELIGISLTTALFRPTINYAKQIKEILPDSFIVLGGPHPSAVGASLLEEINSADGLVVGEGDYAVLELMSELKKKNPNFKKVKGLSFREKSGRIYDGGRTDLIKDIDSLPFPAIDLFNLEKYKTPLNIMTSRGCPYFCKYCFKGLFGSIFRQRSPENVVDELAYYKERFPKLYKERPLPIGDDCFNLNMVRAKKICDLIVERKLQAKFVCGTGLRGDRLDEELVNKIKQIGTFFIFFGVESGDQEQMDYNGKSIDMEKLASGIDLVKKAGITTGACFIVDLPGTNEKTIQNTIKYMRRINVDKYNFSFATPYPGTELYKWIRTTPGVKILETSSDFDKDRPFFETPELSEEKSIDAFNRLVSVANKITLKKYLHPRRIINVISNMKRNPYPGYRKEKFKQLAYLLINKKIRRI